ncbi:hypothetical protein HRJ34_06580 [Rhizorhabdus wittichii]|uniref:Tetratricopeptide repeat protein n=1 Tax=Rhizorhabdus wittichii TaxID=160791 RepID=A0A975D7K3_9SPHN|nr:hypothetical protein [Rhizorhabdus wittichii]QTH23170.1 hypothetical protein HRJ34_06580 [Rhizorhabdus wittichii]
MVRFDHHRARLRRLCLILPLVPAALLGGCAAGGLGRAVELTGVSAPPEGFETARREPLNARAHIETGLQLLARGQRTSADIALAKSGFQTAARLAPDLWEPLIGLAAAHYRLGEYRDALAAFSAAVERCGAIGDFALPYALVAYRAQEPELARLAFAAAPPGENADFLRRAFTGPAAWRPSGATAASPPKASGQDGNILIEAFLIRDTRSAGLSDGINLLDSLALQFGGTLVNYSYDSAGHETRGDVSVTLPGISYSLNLAARDLSRVSLEASPLVLARQGKTSKFLEGGSVLIVPLADDSDPVERDVGITVEVTPEQIGEDYVDLAVVLELSNITGQSLSDAGRGASLLQTDKTRVEAAARVPFRKAVLVGSTGSLTRRKSGNRSLVAAPLPGLSTNGSSASRRDVLALISVRRADDQVTPPLDADALAKRLFDTALPAPASYGERPSDTPDPGLELLLTRSRR